MQATHLPDTRTETPRWRRLVAAMLTLVVTMAGLALVDPQAATAQDFQIASGEWRTTYGNMVFSQSGSTVTAVYDGQDGTIEGTLDLTTRTLTGYWVEPSSARSCSPPRGTDHWGRISWVFAADGRSFDGTWGYCDDNPTRGWNGTGPPGGDVVASLSVTVGQDGRYTLDGTASAAGNGIDSYEWTVTGPGGTTAFSGATAEVPSAGPGPHSVSLTVTAGDGEQDTASGSFDVPDAELRVTAQVPDEIAGIDQPFTAIFFVKNTGGTELRNVRWAPNFGAVLPPGTGVELVASSRGDAPSPPPPFRLPPGGQERFEYRITPLESVEHRLFTTVTAATPWPGDDRSELVDERVTVDGALDVSIELDFAEAAGRPIDESGPSLWVRPGRATDGSLAQGFGPLGGACRTGCTVATITVDEPGDSTDPVAGARVEVTIPSISSKSKRSWSGRLCRGTVGTGCRGQRITGRTDAAGQLTVTYLLPSPVEPTLTHVAATARTDEATGSGKREFEVRPNRVFDVEINLTEGTGQALGVVATGTKISTALFDDVQACKEMYRLLSLTPGFAANLTRIGLTEGAWGAACTAMNRVASVGAAVLGPTLVREYPELGRLMDAAAGRNLLKPVADTMIAVSNVGTVAWFVSCSGFGGDVVGHLVGSATFSLPTLAELESLATNPAAWRRWVLDVVAERVSPTASDFANEVMREGLFDLAGRTTGGGTALPPGRLRFELFETSHQRSLATSTDELFVRVTLDFDGGAERSVSANVVKGYKSSLFLRAARQLYFGGSQTMSDGNQPAAPSLDPGRCSGRANRSPDANDDSVTVDAGSEVVITPLLDDERADRDMNADVDPDGGQVTLTYVSPIAPRLTITQEGSRVRIRADHRAEGTHQVPYLIEDDEGDTAMGVIRVTVAAVPCGERFRRAERVTERLLADASLEQMQAAFGASDADALRSLVAEPGSGVNVRSLTEGAVLHFGDTGEPAALELLREERLHILQDPAGARQLERRIDRAEDDLGECRLT